MIATKTWLRNLSFLKGGRAAQCTSPRGEASRRPQLEALEARELLAADWFSTYLPNAAVAGLVRNDWYGHGSVTRNDMLSVYAQVERDGVVDSGELASLKFLSTYGNLLNMSDPVRYLSGEVVSTTDAADLHYQGMNIGYIGVNSPSWKLQSLVNKWFLGMDHPTLATGAAGSYTAAYGSVFGAGGPKYTDIYQGGLGDCTYLASMAETAARTGAIGSMFTANGDNTWTVRFYRNGSPAYVTVDNMLPGGGGLYDHPHNGVLWAALAEKALAQLNESGWLGTLVPGVNSYRALDNGSQATMVTALSALSGWSASGITIATNGTNVAQAMAAGKLVVLGTGNSTGLANIEHNHAYAVVGYNASASLPFTVFNPWGDAGGYDHGTFIWGQFTANGAALRAYFAMGAVAGAAPDVQGLAAGLAGAFAGGTVRERVAPVPVTQPADTVAATPHTPAAVTGLQSIDLSAGLGWLREGDRIATDALSLQPGAMTLAAPLAIEGD
jgi:hypothetical protein